MKLQHVSAFLEGKFPSYLQEDYDNSGWQLGDPQHQLTGVLVALDCTEAIVEEAIRKQCNLIIAHHPILFKGLKRLGVSSEIERIIHRCIKHDIAIYAIHTNLDNHIQGVNGKIAEKIGLHQCKILAPKGNTLFKLSFYTPVADQAKVHQAVCEAGAGMIGNYYNCGFSIEGKGTFTPNEFANPTLGQAHVPTELTEVKMEYVVSREKVHAVLDAAKNAHPYEEVAHEIIMLHNTNQEIGSGLIGQLNAPMDELAFLKQLKETFQCEGIRHTALLGKPIQTVAVCGGAGSFLLADALRQKADVFISGDFKYHEFFGAENRILIADIGHYESEQYTSELIVGLIREKFPTFAVQLTENNTNPINFL